ncbi:MAG: DUF5693 family protein [Armatimonadota bacterium]
MTRAQKMFTEALIVIGLLAAVWVAVGRVMVEQTNRSVGMAVDWQEVVQLAGCQGVAPRDVLVALESAGATHLAVAEEPLEDIISRGEVALFRRGGAVEVYSDDDATLQRVAQALKTRFPGTYQKTTMPEGETWLSVPPAAVSVPDAGVGYPRAALAAANALGLKLVLRPRWQGVRTAAAISHVMQAAGDAGAEIVVFDGEQVVGFPEHVDVTAHQMRRLGLTFGLIELTPQLGAQGLATRLRHQVVRVHSITEPEMRTIGVRRAVERFVRAARERGVRLLYLRMLPASDAGLLEGNADYLHAVQTGLRETGLTSGIPRPYAPLSTAPWRLALVQLGVVGAGLWLLQALFGLQGRHFWPLALVLIAGGAAAMFVAQDLGRTVAALGAAVVFPIIAVCYAGRAATAPEDGRPGLLRALPELIGAFLIVCAVSAFGGLLVVGLLGETTFMIKVAQFRGVKVAQLLPILAVALVWLARSTRSYEEAVSDATPEMVDYRSGETVAEWPALWRGLREAFASLVAYWHVAAVFAALALLAMLMLRSGNQPEGAVLPMELELRSVLDRLLVVRPRTKEVFLGHPVMLLGLLLALRDTRRGLWIALAVGTIGQISLVNSFCHIHTPLLLTVMRVLNGMWLGAVGGLVLCVIWDALGGAPPPEAGSAPPEQPDDEQ